MRRWLAKVVDIRAGEATLTLLMGLYYYLILVTYYLLKPARDSLFLVKLGAAQLPIVFILTALIIAPITTIYSKASRTLKLTRLLYITSLLLITNLIIMRWLLTYESSWVFYLFYVWVSIYGAMTASQFWLFANAVYTPAQGKRLFGMLNLGGIIGAMTGGELTSLIVRRFAVRTEDLLFICMGLIAGVMLLIASIWKLHTRDAEEAPPRTARHGNRERGESFTQIIATIKRSKHLTYLVWIIALTMATASFVDYQFKTASAAAFPDKESLTAFLGVFYGRLSLASLILQLLFGYRILRLLGVAGIILFLPVGLMLGSAYMLIAPGIVAATLLRGADGAFKYSLDKTGRELLFLPIPLAVKKRTKVFIDMFVDRWFRGVAGGVLLLLTAVFGMGMRELSVVVIVLLTTWIILVLLIRKEYVNAFRDALRRREIDPAELTVNISDAATMKALREALRSEKERDVSYALSMLKGSKDPALAEDVRPLLAHGSHDVRVGALLLLSDVADGDYSGVVEPLVRDAHEEVRRLAILFVAERAPDGPGDVISRYIADPDARVAASALRCAGTLAGRGPKIDASAIDRLAADDDEFVRAELARALGDLADARWHGVIRRMMDDTAMTVAGEAIRAAGATRERQFVPELIGRLDDVDSRRYVRESLASYGNSVVGTLGDYLGDDSVAIAIRRNIPTVLSRIPTQQSADALAENLTAVDASLRFLIIKALNKLRSGYPDLRVTRDRVDAAFIAETRLYYEVLQIAAVEKRDSPGDKLLLRALNERLQLNLERCFRLLGLQYPADDIYNAYLGLVSTQKDRHASAIEFLDNVLGKKLKTYFLPIIDPVSENDTLARGRSLFADIGVQSRDEALLRLMQGSDAWLRALAVYCAAESSSDEVRAAVENCRHDHDPVVVETATFVSQSYAT